MIYDLNAILLSELLEKSENPLVVLFSKDTCPACVLLKPEYNELSEREELREIYRFFVVDVKEDSILAEKFGTGTPTIYVFFGDDGVEIPFPEEGYSLENIENYLMELML